MTGLMTGRATPILMLGVLASCLILAPARAEQCRNNLCATSKATRSASGFDVVGTLRSTDTRDRDDYYNVVLPGKPQQEVHAKDMNATLNFKAPADWNGIWAVQSCWNFRVGGGSSCNGWVNVKTELPKATPALVAPDAAFCDWYASEAVARAGEGAKCGFTGARWAPNKQLHASWCITQPTQQQVRSEDSERKGQLADCAKKEAAASKATPGKGNVSFGPPEVIVDADVDIYDAPGGTGQKLGILRKDSKVQLTKTQPDKWCGVAGNAVVPKGHGYVWCGPGFELD
jgi:hypothetical protein